MTTVIVMLKCFMIRHYLNYVYIVISRLLCAASKELHRTSYCTNMRETTKFVSNWKERTIADFDN